jgi:hypothetical protein
MKNLGPSQKLLSAIGHYRYAQRTYALGKIWTISVYIIISNDINLANINLNYMFLTCSKESFHFGRNPSFNNNLKVTVHKL